MRGKTLELPGMQGVQLQEQSPVEQLLTSIAQNQGALHNALQAMIRQNDILIRIACGADSKAAWKKRFETADADARRDARLAEDAARGQDVDGPGGNVVADVVGQHGDEETHVGGGP